MCIKYITIYSKQIYYIFTFLFNLRKINICLDNKNCNEVDDILINNIKISIDNIGIFAIKMVQWIIEKIKITNINPKMNKVIDSFENYYEKCPYHEFNYTKNLYKKEFDKELLDIYDINKDPIASGSIGQVYVGSFKNNKDNKVAIKITHPNIQMQLFLPKIIVKFINFLLKTFRLRDSYYNIPFDLDDFFDYLNKQIDLRQEYKNMEIHRNHYKDNSLIIIPKVYEYSRNVLVMSYEEGTFYENLDVSDYKKVKILTIMRLYLRSSLIMNNFIHGDLHNGNWKVRQDPNDENNFQIILYDLGLCVSLKDDQFVKKFFKFIDEDNNIELSKLLFDIIKKDNISENRLLELREELHQEISNLKIDQTVKVNKVMRLVLSVTLKNNILIENEYFNLFCTTINGGNHVTKYCENTDIYEEKIKKNNSYKLVYPSLISFCKTYNCFNDYCKYMQNLMNNNNKSFKLFEDIEDKLEFTLKNKLLNIESDLDTDSDDE